MKYLFSFRELLEKRTDSIRVENPTVKKVLEKLFAMHGDDFKQRIVDRATGKVRFIATQPRDTFLSPKAGHIRKDSLKAIRIIVNGRLVYNLDGIDTKLEEGDVITIY